METPLLVPPTLQAYLLPTSLRTTSLALLTGRTRGVVRELDSGGLGRFIIGAVFRFGLMLLEVMMQADIIMLGLALMPMSG